MNLIVFILLAAPGMLTWIIERAAQRNKPERTAVSIAKWLVYDLLILFGIYLFCHLLHKDMTIISFSPEYQKDLYHSVYRISFIMKYSFLDISFAAALAGFIVIFRKSAAMRVLSRHLCADEAAGCSESRLEDESEE